MRRLPLSPGIRTCTCFGVRRQHDASSGFLAKGVWVMRKTGMIGLVIAASMSLGACTTYDRGYGSGYAANRDSRGAATGADVDRMSNRLTSRHSSTIRMADCV